VVRTQFIVIFFANYTGTQRLKLRQYVFIPPWIERTVHCWYSGADCLSAPCWYCVI